MKREIPQKNFYAVLTSEVLFNKELSCRQKILIAMISNMSNEKGYCWASNDYFAECLDICPRTLQRDLEDLEKKKLINRVIKFDPNNNEYQRILTIVDEPPVKKSTGKVKKSIKKQEEPITFTDPQNQSVEQELDIQLFWSKILNIYTPSGDKSLTNTTVKKKREDIIRKFTKEEREKILEWFFKYKTQLDSAGPWIGNFFNDKKTINDVAKFFFELKDFKPKQKETTIKKFINDINKF